jgi:hypothetical protein
MPKEKKDTDFTHIAVMRDTAKKIRTWYKVNKGTTIYKMVDDAVNYYLKEGAK